MRECPFFLCFSLGSAARRLLSPLLAAECWECWRQWGLAGSARAEPAARSGTALALAPLRSARLGSARLGSARLKLSAQSQSPSPSLSLLVAVKAFAVSAPERPLQFSIRNSTRPFRRCLPVPERLRFPPPRPRRRRLRAQRRLRSARHARHFGHGARVPGGFRFGR